MKAAVSSSLDEGDTEVSPQDALLFTFLIRQSGEHCKSTLLSGKEDPTAGSPTVGLCYDFTPSHESQSGKRPPGRLLPTSLQPTSPWCDGRCVQGPGTTYSLWHSWIHDTSDSDFMESSCRLQSDYDAILEVRLLSRVALLFVCAPLENVAPAVAAMMT